MYISAVERIYREISQPSPPKPSPKAPDPPQPISLDIADVQDILKRQRSATVEELAFILENWKKFSLTLRQRNDLSLRMTITLASRGRPNNPNAELYRQLDIAETPVGLLHHASWYERELRTGAQAIVSCKLHLPPRCQCWRVSRERLWAVQDKYGERSPETWAATKLYEQFEEYEATVRKAGHDTVLPPIPE
jgi:hypothetical protein